MEKIHLSIFFVVPFNFLSNSFIYDRNRIKNDRIWKQKTNKTTGIFLNKSLFK